MTRVFWTWLVASRESSKNRKWIAPTSHDSWLAYKPNQNKTRNVTEQGNEEGRPRVSKRWTPKAPLFKFTKDTRDKTLFLSHNHLWSSTLRKTDNLGCLSGSDDADTLASTGTWSSAPRVEEEQFVVQVVAPVRETLQWFLTYHFTSSQAQLRTSTFTLCLWRDFLAIAPTLPLEGESCNMEDCIECVSHFPGKYRKPRLIRTTLG